MSLPILGTTLVWCGLAAIIAMMAAYLSALAPQSLAAGDDGTLPLIPKAQKIGRVALIVAAACVFGVAAVHLHLILTHRFDINYVYSFSARELPPFYLFATFWAGQEGSIILWTVWSVVIGVVLAFTSGRSAERRVMPIFGGVGSRSCWCSSWVKSPFAPLPGNGPVPADGQGLNPLLENPWMVVHPPTLFLGFASLAPTFAFAVAALVWGDGQNWIRRAWPWALFSFAVLGFGIMLGGYWAYETLGWGGFWGWDPVENGPLVPWLGMTAFLHSALTTRARGSLKKTTLISRTGPICSGALRDVPDAHWSLVESFGALVFNSRRHC